MNAFYLNSTLNSYFSSQLAQIQDNLSYPSFPSRNQQQKIPKPSQQHQFKSQFQYLSLKYEQLLQQNRILKEQLNKKLKESEKRKNGKYQLRKKYIRRKEEQLQKNIRCPYENCRKQYLKQSSLNFHIKQKHNGGSKSERFEVAKRIILANKKGINLPVQKINLPPGYIQQIRQNLLEDDNLDSDFIYSQQSQQKIQRNK